MENRQFRRWVVLAVWAGFDSELSIADRFSITTAFEYHYAYYEATADWNLRDDF